MFPATLNQFLNCLWVSLVAVDFKEFPNSESKLAGVNENIRSMCMCLLFTFPN